MLAPDDYDRNNHGVLSPNEHIGHMLKEYAARLAPIIDDLAATGMLNSVQFDCFLRDSDTAHQRNGYYLNIVVMCNSNTSEFCSYLRNIFIAHNL